jgi:TctA family transporter
MAAENRLDCAFGENPEIAELSPNWCVWAKVGFAMASSMARFSHVGRDYAARARGAVSGSLAGLLSSVGLVALSPGVWTATLKLGPALFPFDLLYALVNRAGENGLRALVTAAS